MLRFALCLLLITLVSLAAFSGVQPHPVSYAATPTYQCSGADFQFPMKGYVGWLWHDPRSQWYDPATNTLPDTDNGNPLTGNPIIHAGLDMFPISQNASDLAVYPLADGVVVRLVGNQVGSQPFNIWYPKQRVYSYFTHVNHNLVLGQEVSANQQIGTVVGHIHFSISHSQTPPPQNPDGTVDKTKLPTFPFSDLDPTQTRDPSTLFRANLADPTNYAWKDKFGPTVDYVDKEGDRFPRATAPEGAPKNVAWTGRESTYCSGIVTSPTPLPSTAVDVMLIIDSSGSMATTDPDNKRLQAALTYLTASVAGDRVGVVDFDGTAKLASGLREALVENQPNQDLINAINTIDSVGSTNIRAGIEVACQELQTQGQATRRGAILLTDGEHVEGPFETPQKCFADQGWPIYTFGFAEASQALLDTAAKDTGGESRFLRDVTNLVCEFQGVRARIAGAVPNPCLALHLEPSETKTTSATLRAGQAQATFSASWEGSDIVMTLTTPSGRVIDRNTDAQDVVHDKGAAFEVYTITNPEPGEWKVDLFAADVPPEGEDVVFGFTTIPSADEEPTPTTITVPGTQPWTDTGLDLNQGDQVTITASGTIKVSPADPGKTPAGDPDCIAQNGQQLDKNSENWLTPGLSCWSLVGRIGEDGAPFQIGTSQSFSVQTAGRLYLGLNDEIGRFGNNSGSWTVEITVEAATSPNAAVTLPINDTTPGYYNNALGTILDGTQPEFPPADSLGDEDPTIFPADEPDLSSAANVLGDWLAPDPLPLNSNWSGLQSIPSTWQVNTETAIVYPVDAGPDPVANVRGNFGVDNGIFVWVNGEFKFGALAPGGVEALEYTDIDLGSLKPGLNYIQILREDHSVATGFTLEIAEQPEGD